MPMPRVLLRRLAVGAGVIGAVAVAGFVWAMFFYDGRQDIDLAPWAEGERYSSELMPGARWATGELCDSDLPCFQAVASETLTMYRFDHRQDAVAAAERFGAATADDALRR
ncbi:hypothetical protein [Blastococcus goldschmidtiae]|uniref:Uncharacterized protein n=1 Tax=Blastococcus goldschmidtiae TaxID=3075546 RepID=A0ABU2KDQ6_9ACTN|nr:hypothetical protein [Blastococcus sp. DSM 46792]MDT0278318.1 hypothetical protein [Blastococcus sp. DSM 46792]